MTHAATARRWRLCGAAGSLTVAVLGGLACEQRFSALPPPDYQSRPASSSSSSLAALLAPEAFDAGRSYPRAHAITITRCSAGLQPCGAPEQDGAAERSYRVAFGSGSGTVRTRGQATADLYKELRDRSAAGERLDAEFYMLADGGSAFTAGAATGAATGSDALVQCAIRLLDLADGPGQVVVDVVHSSSDDCMVSMGRAAYDGGASQCLVQEPERPGRPGGRGRGGMSF